MIQENQNEGADEIEAGEVVEGDEVISISKKEFEKLNQTLGSLKRENKDLKKPKETPETPLSNKPSDDVDFGQLAYYNTKDGVVRVVHDDDVEYLRATMKETGKSMSDVLGSRFFQSELKDRQEARLVVNATPTSSKRSGEQGDPLEIAYTKYIQTNKLPDDPILRERVVNKRIEREARASQFTSNPVVE